MWDTNWDLCRICRTSFILKQIKSMYVHISPYWWSVVWIDFHKKHNYHIFLWPFPGILYFLSPQNDLSCLNGQLSRKHTFHSLRFSQMEKWLHLLTNNHRPNILKYFKYFRYFTVPSNGKLAPLTNQQPPTKYYHHYSKDISTDEKYHQSKISFCLNTSRILDILISRHIKYKIV